MSGPRRGGLALLCIASAACAAGCGGGDSAPAGAPPKAPPTPAAIDICGAAGTWRELRAPVAAAALGRGPAVVFLNDSSNDTCAWMSLGHAIADSGRTAVVFKYDSTAPRRAATRAALAVARSAAGGGSFALVGASLGGRIVFEAAARAPHGLAGIVSLSGERQIDA